MALYMEVGDVNLVDVGVRCSMVHAILDMLVAHIDGWVTVVDAGIDQLEPGKEPAGAWSTQGRDESIQALAVPQEGDGRLPEGVAECFVVRTVEKYSSVYQASHQL